MALVITYKIVYELYTDQTKMYYNLYKGNNVISSWSTEAEANSALNRIIECAINKIQPKLIREVQIPG